MADFTLSVFKDKTVEEIMHINPDFPLDLYSQIYTYNIDYSLFKEDIIIIENLVNLENIGTNLFNFSCFPLNIEEADGSPVRAIAYLDQM